MKQEMTPDQAWAKLQEIREIVDDIGENPTPAAMMKYLTWLMQDRIEQLKSIASQK